MKLKSLIYIFLFLLVIFLIGYFVYKKVGDFRPAFLPTSNGIVKEFEKAQETIQTGEPVDFPLKITDGFEISLFAKDLTNPRDIEISPEGYVLVSSPATAKVWALFDRNKDGIEENRFLVVSDLAGAHGIAFYEDKLYVAGETALNRYHWTSDAQASFDKKILDLPAGGRHSTRSIDFDEKGNLYVSLGSTCDTCFENHPWLAAVIATNKDGDNPRVYSKGLRNAVFIKYDTITNKLWATEMGRDFLGDDLPPDEVNILQDGGNYGWPVCYGDKVYDTVFNQLTSKYCENTIAPAFNIQAHSAPLGLNFINSAQFPDSWQGDLLVSYHGSWNRSVPVGYKVVHLIKQGEKIVREEDFITGFLQGRQALGRPVDLEFDNQGSLLISDDKAGVIYKVTRSQI